MYDLIIIGAGPAGLTAALYAGRARLKTLILEKMGVGGQLMLTTDIENFPGFAGGVTTERLVSEMEKQVRDLEVEIKTDEVTRIIHDDGFKIYGLEAGYQAKCVIVASGASPKRLDIPGEDRFTAKGVSYCATCDGPLYKGKDIFVVGGGDKAVEEAIHLAKYAKKITLIHRRQELRASKILQERLFRNKKIEVLFNVIPQEILGSKLVESIKINNLKSNDSREVVTSGVFVFVGVIPNTGYLKDLVKFDDYGFVLAAEDMSTNCEGLFVAGDCRKKGLRQAVTACSDGAIAASIVSRYLEHNERG